MSAVGSDVTDRQQVVEKYYGKYPGVVVDNKARNNDGHRGEVLVEVPGILEDREDKQVPMRAWAKPCFLPSFFFVPEVGDHVWVEFAAGDINFPIWSGVWYPKGKSPQTIESEAPTELQRIIRANNTSNLVIQMDGNTGSIQINDNNGNSISLDSKGITITASKTVTVKGTPVNLGDENAMEHLLLGDTFNTSIWSLFANHSHTTATGPSSPPVPPALSLAKALSQIVKTK